MCIDLVGVQYIRKIHYFGRKIQDARSALAVVGGKVFLSKTTKHPIVLKHPIVFGVAIDSFFDWFSFFHIRLFIKFCQVLDDCNA